MTNQLASKIWTKFKFIYFKFYNSLLNENLTQYSKIHILFRKKEKKLNNTITSHTVDAPDGTSKLAVQGTPQFFSSML